MEDQLTIYIMERNLVNCTNFFSFARRIREGNGNQVSFTSVYTSYSINDTSEFMDREIGGDFERIKKKDMASYL